MILLMSPASVVVQCNHNSTLLIITACPLQLFDEEAYFTTAFDLILSLYEIAPRDPAVADLRESLRGPERMGSAAE